MRSKIPAGLGLVVILAGAAALAQAPSYVGSAKCQLCHKTERQGQQFPIWEKSGHSKSAAALMSPHAASMAQAMGVKDPASDPKCLGCHIPLADKAPDLKAEGVTCEVCHGPGSDYKSLAVMKDKDEAVKKGLKLYGSPEAIQTWCLTCHKDAHGKSFDFAAAWDKVKHPTPAK